MSDWLRSITSGLISDVSPTPGPWTPDQFGMAVRAEQDQMKICDIRGWGYLTGVGGLRLSDKDAIKVQIANARLIAAAPDLLRAAKGMLDYLTTAGVEPCDEGCTCVFDDIRKAIAKAGGAA